MDAELARQRYLQRHIEPGLPACPAPAGRWQSVLVVPAYREPASLLQNLASLPDAGGRTLVILVLNRPDSDSDPDANNELRGAITALSSREPAAGSSAIRLPGGNSDLYLHDLDRLAGPLPAAQGVGLARKTGCDIAFKWMDEGAIAGDWICCTDADASLPADYFTRLQRVDRRAVAAVYPFRHLPGGDETCNSATALYELRLHHYVLGLEYAGSPYAFHTLGSCLAVRADGYAQVRGFPRRSGGEDFYLLNKLAKLGTVHRLQGECIRLQSRYSSRVPFGTGPAVGRISDALQPGPTGVDKLADLPRFYHPACFEALRHLLLGIPSLRRAVATAPVTPDAGQLAGLVTGALADSGLREPLLQTTAATVVDMGLAGTLAHCHRQSRSEDQFLRQFHQWFDAFRTLKFIHGVRDAGWPPQTLAGLGAIEPRLWPSPEREAEVERLRDAAASHWGWTV